MNEKTVELGDEVKDEVTSFHGVVIGMSYWLNQCARAIVQPRKLEKDGKMPESQTIDVTQLTIIKKSVVKPAPTGQQPTRELQRADSRKTGGPSRYDAAASRR